MISVVLGGCFLAAPSVGAVPVNSKVLAASCEPGKGTLPTTIFVPWYKYLEGDTVNGKCVPRIEGEYVKAISSIALAVLDTLLRISGVLALGYTLWGSVQYVISQGNQQDVANAKSTVVNALTGLVIVLVSIGLVQFIGGLARGS